MRPILFEGVARRLSLGVTLLAALTVILVSQAPSISSQAQQPVPPAWFFGTDAQAYAGATIEAINENGTRVAVNDEEEGRVDSQGTWSFIIAREDEATRVKFRIVHTSGTLESTYFHVVDGNLTEISVGEFTSVAGTDNTIAVRIIARRADDGRIEFGMRGPDGEDILPPARFFPDGGPGHSRWLRSTEIDFGGGFVGRIIARYVAEDGRTEFGFRVEGYDDNFPRARFFPASGPDHNRWLRSSEIEIGMPR